MPSWLVLSYLLSFGFAPSQNEVMQTPYGYVGTIINDDYKNTVIKLGFTLELFDFVRIKDEIQNYQSFARINSNVLPTFYPYRINYIFNAELFYNDFSIGILHECDHPIESGHNFYYKYLSSNTEIYFKIEGKL